MALRSNLMQHFTDQNIFLFYFRVCKWQQLQGFIVVKCSTSHPARRDRKTASHHCQSCVLFNRTARCEALKRWGKVETFVQPGDKQSAKHVLCKRALGCVCVWGNAIMRAAGVYVGGVLFPNITVVCLLGSACMRVCGYQWVCVFSGPVHVYRYQSLSVCIKCLYELIFVSAVCTCGWTCVCVKCVY